MAYLLEVYCFLRYEASDKLRNGILNNWLVNVKGELGKWLPADLHQEHYNRWLEDMVQKHGGEFDNKFYRETISPNVEHFLRIKEEITTAFSLKRRSKTHTSPHLRDELHLLLTMLKDEEVHLFRSGRSMGHCAVNQFARGCRRLEAGKLDEWLEKSTCVGDFLQEFNATQDLENQDDSARSDSPAREGSEDSDSHSNTGSASPTPSTSNSTVSTRSDSSTRSACSVASIVSGLDTNEPEDDGEDRSGAKLSSGSYRYAYTDPDTGFLTYDDEAEAEDEPDEIEIEIDEQEPDDDESRKHYTVDSAVNSDGESD